MLSTLGPLHLMSVATHGTLMAKCPVMREGLVNKALMEHLLADIERTASLLAQTRISNATDRLSIIEEAKDLLESIRKSEGQIQDPKIWQTIHTRANELDIALEDFSS